MTTRGGVCTYCLYERGETNESMWMWRRGREKQDMITKLNNHSASLLSSSTEWHPTFCCFGFNCSSWRRMKRTVDWISARERERVREIAISIMRRQQKKRRRDYRRRGDAIMIQHLYVFHVLLVHRFYWPIERLLFLFDCRLSFISQF